MARCPKHCYTNHYGTPHVKCESPTLKGTNCPHHGDRVHPETGEPTCHVHDPEGTFQVKVRAARAERHRSVG